MVLVEKLYNNLGSLHHEITTANPEAQSYFDQGLRLLYAFNHAESGKSFEEAERLDTGSGVEIDASDNILVPGTVQTDDIVTNPDTGATGVNIESVNVTGGDLTGVTNINGGPYLTVQTFGPTSDTLVSNPGGFNAVVDVSGVRIGNVVTITVESFSATITSVSQWQGGAAFIPVAFRPTTPVAVAIPFVRGSGASNDYEADPMYAQVSSLIIIEAEAARTGVGATAGWNRFSWSFII